MNIEAIISEKIQPYSLNENKKAQIAQLVQKYPESLLLDSIKSGVLTYFRYDGEKLTEESVNEFLKNLGGIVYNKSLPPKEQKIRHLKNTLKQKFSNEYCADAEDLLRNYFDELTLH